MDSQCTLSFLLSAWRLRQVLKQRGPGLMIRHQATDHRTTDESCWPTRILLRHPTNSILCSIFWVICFDLPLETMTA